jgi:hypothetical protein
MAFSEVQYTTVRDTNRECKHAVRIRNKQIIVTYSIKSFIEANPFSASQESILILWKPNVQYCNQNSPPPVPVLSQINPVHDSISLFEATF